MATAPELHQQIHRIAEQQHGLITRRQAIDVGISRHAWEHLHGSGAWVRVSARVARRTGAPVTTSQRVLAAALDVGPNAYVSHASAAGLWEVPGFRPEPVELIVVRGGRETPSTLAVTHRPRHLPEPYAAQIGGIPVVRPALLLLQMAARVPPVRLRRMLDGLWARRLLSGPSVQAELRSVMHRGRAGTAALRELLDDLPDGYVPPASGLEARVGEVLARFGLPEMRRQVDLGDEARWCGRVDLVDGVLPLVLEVDSERFHSALTDRADDLARQRRLEAAGFVVARVTDFQVWHRPEEVAAAVRAGREQARCRVASPATGWGSAAPGR